MFDEGVDTMPHDLVPQFRCNLLFPRFLVRLKITARSFLIENVN